MTTVPTWFFPTLRGYDRRSVRYDVLAGVAAGTVVIPQAMAYATLAGLPVQVGLYTCLLPMLAYAVLGGSNSLSLSTTSTIAVLTATTLATMPSARTPEELMRDAFTLTVLVGVVLLVLRMFRMGSLVDQISPATMTGVKVGVGLTVAVSQLPTLLGVPADPEDDGFFGRIADLLPRLDDIDTTTFVISVVAVGSLFLLGRVAPGLPAPLLVAGGGIALVMLTDVEERGLSLVGAVPTGLPVPTMPMWQDISALLPGAIAIALMSFMETVVVARLQRERSQEPVDSDRELLAAGIASLAGGLSQSMPPAGGFSQSAVNRRAGARSQVAGLTTAVLAVLVALFLGPVLEDLPSAILAAMVLMAVLGLVSLAGFREMYAVDRPEFWVAAATAALGLTVGLLQAVLIGVVLTLFLVLRNLNRPQVRAMLRVDGGWRPTDLDRAEATDGGRALVLHLDQSLYTGNARPTQDAVLRAVLAVEPRPARLVLECTQVQRVTSPFITTVRDLSEDLENEGVELVLAALAPAPLEHARQAAWFDRFVESGRVLPTVDAAVAAHRI